MSQVSSSLGAELEDLVGAIAGDVELLDRFPERDQVLRFIAPDALQ